MVNRTAVQAELEMLLKLDLDAKIAAASFNAAMKSIAFVTAQADSTVLNGVGIGFAGVGGSSVPSVASGNLASTNLHTASKRVDLLRTSAAVGNLVGMRGDRAFLWRGNAAGLGGFKFQTRFGPATGQTIASRLFVGLDNDISASTDIEPSTITSMIGVGYDSTDANFQILSNDASGAAAKVNTGIPRPAADRTKVYTLTIECAPNAASINVTLTDEATATTFGPYSVVTDLPPNTVFMAPKWKAGTGAVSSVIGVAFMGCQIESPV